MKLNFPKKSNKPKHKKDGRINPHRFMIWLMSIVLLVVIIEIIIFTYFFVISSRKLDTQVEPKLDTNANEINKLDDSVKKIEDTLSQRVGATSASQNEPSIVQ